MGNAVIYFEIGAADDSQLKQFYADLFGWHLDPIPPGGYSMVDTGAKRGINGGVGGGSASKWATVYAHVPNVDTVLARAEQLGGKREYGPNQVDDHMRTAAIRDPAGNVVGLYEHNH